MRRLISVGISAALLFSAVPVWAGAEEAVTEYYVEEADVILDAADEDVILEPEAVAPEYSGQQAEIQTEVQTEIQTELLSENKIETLPVNEIAYDEEMELVLSEELTSSFEVEQADYGSDPGEGVENGFRYSTLEDDTIEITGYEGSKDGDLIIPDQIGEKTVTRIGDHAFIGYEDDIFTGNLVLPSGLKSIGDSAFAQNKFTGELKLPQELVSIEDSAFRFGSGFTGALVLPPTLTNIGEMAFEDCSGFTGDLALPDGITSLDYHTFSGCTGFNGNLTLPSKLTSIGYCVFSRCENLTGSLELPSGLTSIGEQAFWGCKGFSGNLVLPSGLKSIGNYAFSGCSGFTGSLTLPPSLTTIEESTFDGCSGFTGKLVLPSGLKSIGNSAFSSCSGFTGSLELPSGLTSIGSNAFSNCAGFNGSLTLPSGLTTIEESTFSGCSGFTGNLVLPSGLKSIGNYAFYACSGFTGELMFPSGLTSIGDYAFDNGCMFSGEVQVPESVTKLGKYALGSSVRIESYNGIELFIGDSEKLNVYSGDKLILSTNSPRSLVTWSNGDENIAKVDQNGLLTAVSAGDTTITATVYDGTQVSLPVRVLSESSSGYDVQGPAVRSVSFQTSITKPGVLAITIDVLEEDTGMVSVYGGFQNVSDSNQQLSFSGNWNESPVFTGQYIIEMPVSSKTGTGEYRLTYITLEDEAGNTEYYTCYDSSGKWTESTNGYYVKLDVNQGNNSLSVKNEIEVNFQSSVTNSDIASKLTAMPDGSAAMINYNSGSHTAQKEWFDAIKGEDKTIVLSNDGIQWRFKGTDITEPKSIDCAVGLIQEYIPQGESTEEVLNITFAPNGALPGKATVRIKSDYIFNLYNLSQTLYLYFLKDDNTLQLEDNPAYILDGSEHWCEFEVTHNSTFYVSGKALSNIQTPETQTPETQTPETQTPETQTPETQTPETQAPETQTPETQAPETQTPETQTPETQTPETQVPETQVSDTRVPVSGIKLSVSNVSLAKGKTVKLKATVAPETATDKTLSWKSSKNSVAAVDKNGVVTGKKYGTAIITVTANDGSGKTATCKVTVGYGITYKLNGGQNNDKNPSAYYKKTVKLQNPSRKGYAFKGWYKDQKYKKKITKISSSAKGNLTLYAKWEKIKVGKAQISSLKNSTGQKAVVKYKKVAGADGYEILYSLKKNMKSAEKTTVKKTSATLKKLKKGKTYYVKMRAYRTDSAGKKVYGKYSAVKQVKIK